jgi:hypothetical protein
MRVDSSNARAQVQAAKPPKPQRKPQVEQADRPEPAKPAPQAAKNNRVDLRA